MNFLEQIRQEAIEEVRPILLKEGEKRGMKRGIKRGVKRGVKRGIRLSEKRGELEGMKSGLLSFLETFKPELLPVYEAQILSAQTIEACHSLKEKIFREIGSLR